MFSFKVFLIAAVAASLSFIANCGSGGNTQSSAGLPTTQVVVVNNNGQRFQIIAEVASTSDQHSQGLMYRTSMAANEGMLFMFESERVLSFWMKNTYMPLDMIFISSDKIVVDINHNAQPENTVPFISSAPAQYVLEVNGEFCVEHNISIGDSVEFNE